MKKRNFLWAGLTALTLATPFSMAAASKDITVYRSATCSCCLKWVEYMRSQGFNPKVIESEDLVSIKHAQGVPDENASCHTAVVDGYFVEGHVPAEDVRKLLAQHPQARGLTVPGMPMGSPGMEMPGHAQDYDVLLVLKDGTTQVFSHHTK